MENSNAFKYNGALLYIVFIRVVLVNNREVILEMKQLVQIQNEHNPLVRQHMAVSFACLWIANLWGALASDGILYAMQSLF